MATASRNNPIGPDKSSEETISEHTNLPIDYPHTQGDGQDQVNVDSQEELDPEHDFLKYVGTAEDVAKEYQHRSVDRELTRSYRAWRNEHYEGSKYLSSAYRGRTRLFVPRTRSTVRKNMAATAASLFATQDTVSIEANFLDDPRQKATADTLKENLNYRTTTQSTKSGFPWFQICMGGHLDGQLSGVTISKQHWEYSEDRNGRVRKDRPMVDLVPIENAIVDPAATWHSAVQDGAWFCVRYPMKLDAVRTLLDDNSVNNAWLSDVPDSLLLKGRIEEDRSHTRRAREGGDDRYEELRQSGRWANIWINENFIRLNGIDYHFWSVGRHGFLSEIRETHEAYPALDGQRPYVLGVSAIDPHRVFPMSPVESWQPLQQEINDITNLRLDNLKRSIAPLTLVKRGANVDLLQVQRRGRPDSIVQVDNLDDVLIQDTPGPSNPAYTETSVANNQLDELAGAFSSSSVANNRQLNETVGGMKLMSGSANALTEYDMRVWNESWVEPVMRQLTHMIMHYENDDKVLALAGEKAQTRLKYGVTPEIDDLLHSEVTVKVNAGIGATDPAQKLSQIQGALGMLEPLFPLMEAQGVTPNLQAITTEIMGLAGFRDGGRFFDYGEPGEQTDPETQAAEAEAQAAAEDLAFKREKTAADNETKVQIAQIQKQADVERAQITVAAQREVQALKDRESYRERELMGEQDLRKEDRDAENDKLSRKHDHILKQVELDEQYERDAASAEQAHEYSIELTDRDNKSAERVADKQKAADRARLEFEKTARKEEASVKHAHEMKLAEKRNARQEAAPAQKPSGNKS